MRILLSTGIGRLYLVKSAKSLLKRGVYLYCIQGWIPENVENNRIIRLVCYLLKRKSIANGLKERTCPELENRIYTCAFSEFLINALFIISDKLKLFSRDKASVIGWKCFGKQSKKYLKGFDILHVRSGAGQGGLIERAHKMGIRVVVDHSIAHPAFMEEYLQDEYLKYQLPFNMGIHSDFWKLVLKDCSEADILLVNSDFVRDTFVRAGYPTGKIRVVYCGVAEQFRGLKQNYNIDSTIHILFTGSFGIRKGGEYILRALMELDRIGFEYKMTVVGNFEKEMVDTYPVRNIEYVGHVPQEQLKKYLSESDIYLFPSLCEGCANSGMEALGAGLPVIATKESGLPICDRENALVIRAKNVSDIVESILQLSKDFDLRKRLGQTASMQMKDYTWDKYAEKVISIYKELL